MTQKSPLRDEAQHSALPWRLNDPRNLTTLVYAADGRTAICKMAGGSLEADAAFILRACNSHDALLAAVKAFLAQWAIVEPAISGLFPLQFARTNRQYTGPNIRAELDALAAAIKLAEGR